MTTEEQREEFMRRAIALSRESVSGGGGPFGAVIVKDGNVIAEAHNSVTSDNDPTAHAEVNAIRKASAKLGTFDLTGCELYTSCEPCPMCLGAIYWAHISRLYYSSTREDAAMAGFDDDFIYREFSRGVGGRSIPTSRLLPGEAAGVLRQWRDSDKVTRY